MHEVVLSLDDKARSLGVSGLAVVLLLGSAGCLGEGGYDDITSVMSAVTVTGPSGHSYTFVPTPKTWDDANQSCFNAGLQLVSIKDATEDAWLLAKQRDPLVGGGGAFWFGYTDKFIESVWGWDDGMGNGYVNWQAGEPNNQNNEDCGQGNGFSNGKWNDLNCNNQLKFICEGPPRDPSPTNFQYGVGNTNNATQNYAQFAIDVEFDEIVTLDVCPPYGFLLQGDTYLRLFNPSNSAQVSENNNFCGTSSQLTFAGTVNPRGTYIIHGGCAGSGNCAATVGIRRTF